MQQYLVMTPQILKSADFTKTQKSRYLENKTLFFLQIKKFINYIHIKRCFMTKNSFVAEETFKVVCVVKLKFAFMEWFFYNLVMLIKLYKIRYLNLDKALLFPRKQAICPKNWKLWRALLRSRVSKSSKCD